LKLAVTAGIGSDHVDLAAAMARGKSLAVRDAIPKAHASPRPSSERILE
jgi:lactate dehydrogenase-like 2-hydroxyacid dehydrogenase